MTRMDGRRRHPISREDWRAWTDEHGLSEWVDGEVTIIGTRTTRHQQLLLWLVMLVGPFVRQRGGHVLMAPFEMSLPRSSREPDLMVLTAANLDRIGPDRLEGPADLIVEIVSDDTDHRDHVEKRAEYEAAGVRKYWVLDPRAGHLTAEAWLLDANGRYQPIPADERGRIRSQAMLGFFFDPEWMSEEWLARPAQSFAAATAALG